MLYGGFIKAIYTLHTESNTIDKDTPPNFPRWHTNLQSILNRQFNIRAVVSDNYPTNVSTYKHLKKLYLCLIRDNALSNSYDPETYNYTSCSIRCISLKTFETTY